MKNRKDWCSAGGDIGMGQSIRRLLNVPADQRVGIGHIVTCGRCGRNVKLRMAPNGGVVYLMVPMHKKPAPVAPKFEREDPEAVDLNGDYRE